MEITSLQRKYLQAIEGTPKTTVEIAKTVGTTRNNAWKILNMFVRKGLVKRLGTEQKRRYVLNTGTDLNMLGEKPSHRNGGAIISEEEKAFATNLRESKLVGQRLIDKYRERYPDRSKSGIHHVISVIRREGCR